MRLKRCVITDCIFVKNILTLAVITHYHIITLLNYHIIKLTGGENRDCTFLDSMFLLLDLASGAAESGGLYCVECGGHVNGGDQKAIRFVFTSSPGVVLARR